MASKPQKPAPARTRHNSPPESDHRERILRAASSLLARSGRDALTTRAVAEAAGVQPPVLYRLFGDKLGLLGAVADYGFAAYLARKRAPRGTDDPVESLRAGWRLHIDFGLTQPELYLLMYANPDPEAQGLAAGRAHAMLLAHMQRVAAAGRLRVPEEQAAHQFHAAACGTVMMLLGLPRQARDLAWSEAACEAALAALLTDQPAAPARTLATAALTLRALLARAEAEPASEPTRLTPAERALLHEWLSRLGAPAAAGDRPGLTPRPK